MIRFKKYLNLMCLTLTLTIQYTPDVIIFLYIIYIQLIYIIILYVENKKTKNIFKYRF